MDVRKIAFVGLVAVFGCDPAVLAPEAEGTTSSSTGSATGGPVTTAEASTTSGVPTPHDTSDVTTGGTTSGDAPPPASSSGGLPPDVGLVRPPQSCNPLPKTKGGPTPVWCDE